jgi:hypothetical protein
MSKETGGPAFPFGTAYAGMTLRDYFAAKAMQALVGQIVDWKYMQPGISEYAYKQADAMLEARNQ